MIVFTKKDTTLRIPEGLGNANGTSTGGGVTRDEVQEMIDEAVIEAGAVTEEIVDNKIADATKGLASKSDLNNYATKASLNDYAKKSQLPTKTSELINDSGFIGEQDLKDYVKKDELATINGMRLDEGGNIVIQGGGTGVTVDEAMSETSINPVQNKVITAALKGKASTADLANKADKSELDGKADKSEIPTKTSQLENDSNFLTQHQSLANYYTKTQTNNAITNAVSASETTAANTYAKKTDVSNAVKYTNNSGTYTNNIWTGTQAQYNAIDTKDSHTLYIIL